MTIRLHPHAQERALERGATEEEIIATVEVGEQFPAKFGRVGFRRNIPFNNLWGGRYFPIKQIEAYAVKEANDWVVVTVITK